METIEFRYYDSDSGNNGGIKDDISMTFESESMTIYDLADRFQRFALALGYPSGSLEQVFKDYENYEE